MRDVSIILLFAAIWGFSGCGSMMIGNNDYYEEGITKMPRDGKGGLLNEDISKYYWGEIKIITKPAGLEVELYNRGEPAGRIYKAKRWETDVVGTIEQDNLGYTVCMQSYAKIRSQGVDISQEAASAECSRSKTITERNFAEGTYIFNEGLRSKTTPTIAMLYARTPENKASDYLLIFKKNGKEIARRKIKPSINWWVWVDPILIPIGTIFFPIEMAWLSSINLKDSHYTQTRSYLTQGDIEIDLTKEVQALEK